MSEIYCEGLHCSSKADQNHPIEVPGLNPIFACTQCGRLFFENGDCVGNVDDRWFFENDQVVRKDADGNVIPSDESSPTRATHPL